MAILVKINLLMTFLYFGIQPLTAQSIKTTPIKGSGNVITKTVTTQPYNVINVRGSMEVFIEKGKEGTIQVTAEDNVQEYILVKSDGKTLTISQKKNISLQNTQKIKIKVPFDNLSELTLLGSGKIKGKDLVKSDVIKLSLRGSGEMELNVNTNSIDARLNGSGEIKLSGNTKGFEVKVAGSGDFKGEKLITENTQVYISGSGEARVNAKNSLNARIQGSGNIFYGGNPVSNEFKVLGSGKIKPM